MSKKGETKGDTTLPIAVQISFEARHQVREL
jgi:hypothetical protein